MATVKPTLAGFLAFIRDIMGVPTSALPDADPIIPLAFAVALELVLPAINTASPLLYTQAVYNLGGDTIINFANDQPGSTYFFDLRDKWLINKFVSGVVQSSNDQGTGNSMVVQEAAKNFTLANIQSLKTPYGRAYLAIAQAYGPSIWGLT